MKGFVVELSKDGEQGKESYSKGKFDLAILDVMLPKKDGFWLGEVIKAGDPDFPIIFLTAKNQSKDAIKGLRIGADDYVSKPFNMEELVLRINGVLNRARKARENPEETINDIRKIGEFEFNPNERTLIFNGKSEKLTGKESQLLRLLIEKKNQLLERNLVLNSIWKDDSYFSARSMDVYVSKLRKKLGPDPKLEIINVHGSGFRLVEKK